MAKNSGNGEGTRPKKASVVFVAIDENGKEVATNSATEKSTVARTIFANGVVRDLAPVDFPEKIRHCAELQGFVTRTQRSYNSKTDIAEALAEYDEEVRDLKNGVWVEAGKPGEPRVTLLSEAIVLTLEGQGEVVDDERRADIVEKLKSTSYKEKAMASEAVKMHLFDLRRKAAEARFKEQKRAVKEAGTGTEPLSAF